MSIPTEVPPELQVILGKLRTDPEALAWSLLHGAGDNPAALARLLESEFLLAAMAVVDSMNNPPDELREHVLHSVCWSDSIDVAIRAANFPRFLDHAQRTSEPDNLAHYQGFYAAFLHERGDHRTALAFLLPALKYWAAHEPAGITAGEFLDVLDTAHRAGLDTSEAHRLWTACREALDRAYEARLAGKAVRA